MKLPCLCFLRLLSVLVMLPAVVLSADDPKRSDERSPSQWIFNIDFPGGSIEKLVKSISSSSGAIFNVIGEKADLATEIPAFSLRNADGESLANALNQLIAARGLNLKRAPGGSLRGSRGETNFPIYLLARRSDEQSTAFDSFQLEPFLEKQSIDDIVSAIRTLSGLNPANPPDGLQLKFHPATKLLLVSGTPEAILVASKVISTLSGAPPGPAAEKRRLEAVTAEVMKRRQAREQLGKPPLKKEPSPPVKR